MSNLKFTVLKLTLPCKYPTATHINHSEDNGNATHPHSCMAIGEPDLFMSQR